MPGVPDDAVHHRVDAVRQKVVFSSAVTFNDGYEKEGVREYSGTAGWEVTAARSLAWRPR